MPDPCATCSHGAEYHGMVEPDPCRSRQWGDACDCEAYESSAPRPDLTAKALWRKEHGELSMAVGAAAVTWWEAAQNYDPDEDEVWQRLIRDVSDERMRELLLDEYLMNRFRSQRFQDLQTAIRNLAQHAQHPPLPTGGMTTDERMAKQREQRERREREIRRQDAQARAYREAEEEAENVELIEEVKRRGLLPRIMAERVGEGC